MPPVPLITLRSVAKSFGGRPVFEGLSFTLAAGDHVGLVGPNGSGKSTLLRILAGSEEPDAGERIARKGTRIGYVPQDPVFAPGKTVDDVVSTWKTPAKYTGYTVPDPANAAQVTAAAARVKADAQVIWDETK